jgi:NAD(P)-dependent dehydrogenase (short-subunit alcohol dehydrogenase family)
LDLADLDNIGSFRSRYDAVPGLATKPVDMLILNAGIMALAKRELTKQGIEAQMGTNVVGHFKFAALMIDLCKSAALSRIVVVSSGAHSLTKKINLEDFNREKSYSKWQVYSETKLGNLLFVAKLNRLLEEKNLQNIVAVGCHP